MAFTSTIESIRSNAPLAVKAKLQCPISIIVVP